jgi:hypothetical protein
MATMMMSWSALETADNGGDDYVVISALSIPLGGRTGGRFV